MLETLLGITTRCGLSILATSLGGVSAVLATGVLGSGVSRAITSGELGGFTTPETGVLAFGGDWILVSFT